MEDLPITGFYETKIQEALEDEQKIFEELRITKKLNAVRLKEEKRRTFIYKGAFYFALIAGLILLKNNIAKSRTS